MKNFKRMFVLLAFVAGVAASAAAKGSESLSYKPFPHMFIGVQGGAQTTFTNYNNAKLISPTASLSFGAWFTPVIGARIHANGIWNQGGVRTLDEAGEIASKNQYSYKYCTGDIDLMINLMTLFGKYDYYPFNIYLIGGVGLNGRWDNGDARSLADSYADLTNAWSGTKFGHNARVGVQLDYNICKNLSINLEVDANSLHDCYNSKSASSKDDWQLTAQLGLAFKFGFKKKAAPVVEEVWATRVDTIWYDDFKYKDVARDRDIKKEIFFAIRESDIEGTDAQIAAVAEFLKGVRDAEITISAYADKGTGNPKINMGYSQQRAEKTKAALIEKGVDPSIIKSVEWFGDTVQPYEENDMNRVSIITGHGVYTDKEKEPVKKFRTEEVRYRVQ